MGSPSPPPPPAAADDDDDEDVAGGAAAAMASLIHSAALKLLRWKFDAANMVKIRPRHENLQQLCSPKYFSVYPAV